MSLQDQAGNAVLAAASGTGVINWLTIADAALSVVVGCLSAVGLVYSIIWYHVRIKEKSNDKSDR